MPLPTHHDLAVLTLHARPFSHASWIAEPKLDGYRALVLRDRGVVDVHSRNGKSLLASFPELRAAVAALPTGSALDAELVMGTEEGNQDFIALQQRARLRVPMRVAAAAVAAPAQLHLFDVLAWEGQDVRGRPLMARKDLLAQIVSHQEGRLRSVEWFDGDGVGLFEATRRMGLEGIVMKRKDSAYSRGAASGWLKIKHREFSRPARSWRA